MHISYTTLPLCAVGIAFTHEGLNHPVVATLRAGRVLGGFCPGSSVQLFQGIPYGQPPVKHLRFMPPQPFKGVYTGGVFDATKPPVPCIQFSSSTTLTEPSEDCLNLNVYVPAHSRNKRLPVKVWAYGGSNVVGDISQPLYNACNLATDSIVVAFNYRLGPLGFLGLRDAGIQGNMAIQDYLLVLQWVKGNIAAFGGDADKVLLFGQSAGADNVFAVSALPQAKQLVSGVVLESGGGIDLIPPDIAHYSGSSYAQTLRCNVSNAMGELIDAFQQTPALLSNSNLTLIFGVNLPNTTSLSSPILDGHLLRHQPLKTGSQVPIVVGTTESENTLVVVPIYMNSSEPITERNYSQFLNLWGPLGRSIGQKYPLSRFNSTASTAEAVIRAVTHVTTTISYTCQSFKTLRAAVSANVPAFAYRFNKTPSCPWLVFDGVPVPPPEDRQLYGAAHTSELPYVFANLDNLPFGEGHCNATMREKKLSSGLVAAWTNMAVHGNPSSRTLDWPKFDPCKTNGIYMEESARVLSLDYSECPFWDHIWESLGGVTVPPPSCIG